jgi:hypothetical protein
MKIVDQKKTGRYTITRRDDGVIHIHNGDEEEETLEGIKEAIRIIGEMANYKKTPLLHTFSSFALPSAPIRECWASEVSCPYVIADAFIESSLALKLIGRFYLSINKPERPSKIFNDQEEAIVWLKTFL